MEIGQTVVITSVYEGPTSYVGKTGVIQSIGTYRQHAYLILVKEGKKSIYLQCKVRPLTSLEKVLE